MTPEEIVAAREGLGWTRKRFAEELGVTVHVAWRFEKQGPRTDEEKALVAGTLNLGNNGDAAQVEADLEWTGETIDTEEWRGLKKGDPCRLLDRSDPNKWTLVRFSRYFRSVSQEYVEVYNDRKGGTRCVVPDRIRDASGRRLQVGE